MYVYVCVCICMYLYVVVCICMYLYVFVCICMYLYVCVCICLYLYAFVCMCMYVCESEVINGILSIPLDYVLVVAVDGDAGFSESACVLF